jgi:hypothetical protein
MGLGLSLFETFCVEPIVPQPPQILGPEATGRPENSQRLVFSLIFIGILASSQTLARLLQVYQYDNQDFPLRVSCGNQMVWGIPEGLMKE